MSEEFDSAVRIVPRYPDPPRIGVTMVDGKLAVRELLIGSQVIHAFRNRAELVDFLMQAVSALRYD